MNIEDLRKVKDLLNKNKVDLDSTALFMTPYGLVFVGKNGMTSQLGDDRACAWLSEYLEKENEQNS